MQRQRNRIAFEIAAVFLAQLLRWAKVVESLAARLAFTQSDLEREPYGLQAAGRTNSKQGNERSRLALNLIDYQGGLLVDETGLWIQVVVTRAPESATSSHGVRHTLLTLHGPDGSSCSTMPRTYMDRESHTPADRARDHCSQC